MSAPCKSSFLRRAVGLLGVAILVGALVGCGSDEPVATGPEWAREIPAAEGPDLAPGSRVWATVPLGERGAAALGTFEVVVSANGERDTPEGTVTLRDGLGRLHRDVPTGLVHPLTGAPTRAGGRTAVLIDRFDARGVPARVLSAAEDSPRAAFDRLGTTVVEPVDAVAPLAGESLPRRVVARVPQEPAADAVGRSATEVALEVARSEDTSWLLRASGRVVEVERSSVRPAEPAPLVVGERVAAWSWSDGLEPATVLEVLEDGDRAVVRRPDGTERRLFFVDVLPIDRLEADPAS